MRFEPKRALPPRSQDLGIRLARVSPRTIGIVGARQCVLSLKLVQGTDDIVAVNVHDLRSSHISFIFSTISTPLGLESGIGLEGDEGGRAVWCSKGLGVGKQHKVAVSW